MSNGTRLRGWKEYQRKTGESVEALRNMPYSQYVKTAYWHDLRRRVLARAGFRCQVCNGKSNLEAHHRTYERLGCEHLGDLVCLCGECHRLFHEGGRMPNPPDSDKVGQHKKRGAA